jgi:hypothetical protein
MLANTPHGPNRNQSVVHVDIVIHGKGENRQNADIYDAGLAYFQRPGAKQQVDRIRRVGHRLAIGRADPESSESPFRLRSPDDGKGHFAPNDLQISVNECPPSSARIRANSSAEYGQSSDVIAA